MSKQYTAEEMHALKTLKECAKYLVEHQTLLDHLISQESSLKYQIRNRKDELWDTKEWISRERKAIRALMKEFRKTFKRHKLNRIDLAQNDIPFQGVL